MENNKGKRKHGRDEEENMIREMLEFYTLVPPSPYILKRKTTGKKRT